jgi:predicted metal-dependent peptidase
VKNYKLVKLSAEQLKKWSDLKTKLIWSQPAFTHIFYKMMNPDDTDEVAYFTKDIPALAGTDGRRLLIEPERFFALPLKQQEFVVCHEIAHNMFMHMAIGWQHQRSKLPVTFKGKDLPYHPMIANFAQDFVINAMLIAAGVGEMVPAGLYDKKYSEAGEEGWQEVYHKLFDEAKQGGGKGKDDPDDGDPGDGDGDGDGEQDDTGKGSKFAKGQFDDHMRPGQSDGKDPNSSEVQPSPQEWQQAVMGAMAVARARGSLPAALEKAFEAMLKPKVNWTDHIEGIFARSVGGGSYDFRRLDRRLVVRGIGAPGKSGKGAGTIVVGIDTSGSIYAVPKLIERFFGELAGILEEVRPKRLVVMWCDAEVHRVDEIEDASDLRDCYYKGAPGGGGTSFVPVFEKMEEMGLDDVDALVYLTDGMGDFPQHEPTDYPVIWGSILPESTYPWGQVVQIPNDGSA